jgi:hypothetical protein
MIGARTAEQLLVSQAYHVRPYSILRRSLVAAVIFVAACQIASAQLATSASQSLRQEPQGTVGTASAVAASGTASSASGTLAVPPVCASCPAATTDVLAQRIDALVKAIESSPSAAKPPLIDRWQDSKAVLLNMLSSRLDAWIFGHGEGSVGVSAQIVAILAFSISLIKLMLAASMLNPATPPTPWGRFKAWTRKSGVARGINTVLAALAVIYTGAALHVVLSARSIPEVAQTSINALQESLKACQTSLAATSAQRQPITRLPPMTAALPARQEALDRVSKSCDAAIRATNTHIVRVQKTANAIESKLPWTLTKVFAFLTAAYLIAAITYLSVIASRN